TSRQLSHKKDGQVQGQPIVDGGPAAAAAGCVRSLYAVASGRASKAQQRRASRAAQEHLRQRPSRSVSRASENSYELSVRPKKNAVILAARPSRLQHN